MAFKLPRSRPGRFLERTRPRSIPEGYNLERSRPLKSSLKLTLGMDPHHSQTLNYTRNYAE